MVEQVEEFRPEINARSLTREGEVFYHGEIRVDEIRTGYWRSGSIAKLSCCGSGEAACVKPLAQ